jgi:hypothetical protein
MSAAEIADYVSFRFALRDLHGRADKKSFIDVDSHISYFEKVESDIIALRVYSELAGMEETERVLKTAATGKRRDGTFAGGDRKKFTSEIYSDLPAILRKADVLAVTKIPRRNPAMKNRMIDIMRRFERLKERVPSIPEGKNLYNDADEIFLGEHGKVYSGFVGILSEVKGVDPLVGVEDHYQDAYNYFNPENSHDDTREKLENMMPAMASIEALFGVLKPYHEISDSDIAPPKELTELQTKLYEIQGELDVANEVNRKLLGRLTAGQAEHKFRPSDIGAVEDSIRLLSKFVDDSTLIKDGKVELTPNTEDLERYFNAIKTKLEGTDFLLLLGWAQDSLDSIPKIKADPVMVVRLAKFYNHMAKMTLDTYSERMKKKEELKALMQGV